MFVILESWTAKQFEIRISYKSRHNSWILSWLILNIDFEELRVKMPKKELKIGEHTQIVLLHTQVVDKAKEWNVRDVLYKL